MSGVLHLYHTQFVITSDYHYFVLCYPLKAHST